MEMFLLWRGFSSLLGLFPLCWAQSLVQLNVGLQVGRGQFVYVTGEDLRFDVQYNVTSCKVEVVMNEPVTQRVGVFTPQVFDCHFLPDEVKYTHNGSPLLQEDTVMLRIYRFTDSETFIEPVSVRVRVVEPHNSLIKFGSVPVEVQKFYGLSNTLDSRVLTFQNRPGYICNVRLLTSETNMPALGQLVTDDSVSTVPTTDMEQTPTSNTGPRRGRQTGLLCPGNKPCARNAKEVNFLKVNCEEFLNSHFKYQHLSPPSPETDYIPIRVELRDHSSRALLEAESVWIPVLIRGALQNQPPHAAFMSMFILEVDQFILTPMTTAALDAKDDETPQAQLVFNVTKPPSEGYITHLEDHTKPITSFTWQDLHEMKIAYQPPNCSHTGRRNYEVEFQAIDSTFVPSPAIMVHFSVRTAETNAPRVSWNMGMDLLEGQSRPITWENLQIVDSDNIGAVYLVAVEGPLHGQLSVRGGKGFMFKVHDLHEGVVVYHHSDSDTTRDHIVFRITDGQHSIRHRFPINILPKDDTPPILINNMALEVPEGGSLLLEEYMLLASDLDSSDDYILYQILTAPRAGEVIRRSSPQLPGVLVTSFLQRDLLLGLIYYRHLGDEVFEDSFDFILSDSHQPPNLSQRHTVVVHVSPVKDQLPHEVPGVVRSVTVKETEVIHLTQSHLHFRDPESPDTDLIYSITRPCFSPTAAWLADAGRLFYADSALSMKKDPALPVLKTFTQHAVNHLKVGYMPPLEDIGPEPIFVQFVFSVSDQQGGALSGLVFNITVTPVDNQPPEIFVNLLRLEEGGGVFLTEEHILVRDADSRGDQLLVRLRTAPEHGRVELQGVPLTEGYSFTIQDLRMLRVRYIHDDSETLEDAIGFTATDGTNSADGRLPVQILPVNDQPPLLGLGLRSGLTCKEGGRVQITGENLFATDADSDDARLSYMLVREPALGEIQRGGVMVDKFTQQDVIQELIFYVHTGGEIGPHPVSDPVTLIVSDGEAGAPEGCCHGDAPPVPLHGFLPVYDLNITVLPVNNQAPVITIGHMFMVDEGSVACLCGGFLGATDADSPQDQLLFSLDPPPEHGFIENTLPSPGFEKSNAGLGVVSFSFPHLSAGYINYVQARHRGVEATVDRFVVRVSDGVQKSAPVPFYVIINPTNDEEPSLLLGNFSVAEGGMKDLGPDLLDAVDLDVPADTLTFSVLVPPAHGMLLNGIYGLQMSRYLEMEQGLLQRTLLVKSFTIQQLRQGMKIIYMHDDTETFKDAFSMQLTDGIRAVQGTAHVRVLPVNDEKPWLRRNTGLELVAADRRVISSVLLEVEDADTPAHELLYVLSAGPRFGQLQLKVGAGWTDLRSGQNFTQEDVEMNRLWYQQTATQGLRGHDGFRFHLSDGDHMSAPHSFVISLQAMARGDLTLVTRPVTLTEGERAVLTTDVLMAADGVDRAEELVYVVLVPPEHGQLHTVQNPGVPLDTFTQLDVAALRVCYTHDNSRMASQDAFSFIISNGVASKNGTLLFLIRHGDRIPPTLTNNKGLRLTEGAVVPISPDALELTDPDTAAENLTYTLTQQPQHGKLLLRGHPLSQPRFTQADINNWDLTYQHQSGPAQADKFSFLPSDGTNTGFLQYGQLTEEAVTFTIQVEFVDRKPPGLVTKRIASVVENFPGGKQGIYITSRDLRASDPDSPDQELQFIILRPPHFGHLENTLTGGYIKGRFTQQDLNQRAVLYVIWPSVQGTEDSFEFQVSDPAGNSMPPEVLEVKWSRVEFSVTCFRVCENVGMLALQVTRSGNSVDPAYTGIQVENGTAKIGKDFTHSSANLIQFDPGVNVKTWNIYIKDDGLEETNEKFQVVLKGQKNTVLGQKNRTTIEIVDPRGGYCDPHELLPDDGDEWSAPAAPPSVHSGPSQHADPLTPDPDADHWENYRPRGDVPDKHGFPEGGEPLQDQPVRRPQTALGRHGHVVHPSGVELRNGETIWTFHGINPARPEGRNLLGVQSAPQVHPELEIMPIWSWSSHHHRDQGSETAGGGQSPPRTRLEGLTKKTEDSPADMCPSGWTARESRCFILSHSRTTWSSAQHTCTLLFNSNLTSVHSKQDMAWLWKFARKQPFWIGLTGYRGQWAWTDGNSLTFSRLKKQSSTEFHSQDRLGLQCVLVQNQKKWTPMNCTTGPEYKYICTVPAQNVPQQ
ncbi:FRAS1-related extracellular matrix protein 1b [Paramormyrops kingsleyae]|uniref:FRAS1-related extracellular matrix protein 1b n=1 Tax=Paramormyrops kingsleyae TaxID=1676925 RepID=UPI003B96A04A